MRLQDELNPDDPLYPVLVTLCEAWEEHEARLQLLQAEIDALREKLRKTTEQKTLF